MIVLSYVVEFGTSLPSAPLVFGANASSTQTWTTGQDANPARIAKEDLGSGACLDAVVTSQLPIQPSSNAIGR